jgi:hypothetical protein
VRPNKPVLFLTALVTGLAGVVLDPGAARAAEPTVTELPFGNPADVVSAGDRVFVSGGRDSTQIVVTDAAGTITGTLDGLAGPADLQLSDDRKTLYVALTGADAIVAYDTGSLAESARYATGAGTCPTTLAFTARFVWFGYGCATDTWNGGIGRVDLAAQPAVVTTALTGYRYYRAPVLATALGNNNVLFAGETGLSPWTGWTFAIGTGGVLTQTSTTDNPGSDLADAALDPTGTTLYAASGSPYYVQSFAAADLTQTGTTYQTGHYPTAVEVSRDGTRIAGGASASYDPDVFVFNLDGTVVTQFELGGQYRLLAPSGLAWRPNGRRLYAISNDGYFYETPAHLHVLPVPAA